MRRRIRSRASAPRSASSGTPTASGMSDWKPPAAALEHWRALLHLGYLDPEDQPRSPTACLRHGRAGDHAREHPWPPLLPLRRKHAMLTHPTIDQLRALRLDGMAEAFVELQSQDARPISHLPAGWRCCSIARRRIAALSGSRAGCAMRSSATARRRSRTSTIVPPDGSTRRCSSNWPPAAGSPSIATC